MKIPDNVYDILKYIGTIGLPALAVLVQAVCEALGGDGSVASTIIIAIAVFINSLIQASSVSYYRDENIGQG